jgi:hypothetical protein
VFKSQTKMIVVIDKSGEIAGAVRADALHGEINASVLPLPGQEIREILVPDAVAKLRSGRQLHLALSHLLTSENVSTTHVDKKVEIRKLEH